VWSSKLGKMVPGPRIVNLSEGQLMGHPLSFPLLCVINLAVYRYAIKLWYESGKFTDERRKIRDLMVQNVLVNGDDMLFMSPPDFFPFFLQSATDAGFKLSQGKNYCSPHTCMMNSQVFTVRGSEIVRVGYFNQKFLRKINPVQGEGYALPTQITRELGKMIDLYPKVSAAIPAVLKRWKRKDDGFFTPNWYLPVHLLGYGMDPKYKPSGYKITKVQRLVAALSVSQPNLALYRTKALSIPSRDLTGALPNWRMIVLPGPLEQHESESISDDWLAKLAYASRISQTDKIGWTEIVVPKIKAKKGRLQPMSLETIERYRHVRFVSSNLPSCPPFNLLPQYQQVLERL